ncbi:hypothetical protein VTO42DRAFT_8076 [Malbranchea cinnamomea]
MGNMEVPLASLSLTHVTYDPEDPVAYVSALLALVPQALCVIYATLLWASREVEVLLMFTGQMLCEVLNWVLKRIIRQERPPQMNAKGYGMPSSHAQFVGFFSFSVTFFLLIRHVPDLKTNSSPASFGHRAAFSIFTFVGATAVAASRIYLNYHTPEQVIAGYIIGMICAVAWFLFTSYLRKAGWVDWALDTELFKSFRMRDLLTGEDLVEAGWQKWEAKRKAAKKRNAERKAN